MISDPKAVPAANYPYTELILEPLSKKCNIWCHKGYTGKNEKQVGCYVNLDGVETFSDT